MEGQDLACDSLRILEGLADMIESFDWEETGQMSRRKYDWAQWMNGESWRIYLGEDYEIPTENMRVTLHQMAEKKGLKVRTTKKTDEKGGESLVFQFFDPAQRTVES